MPQSIPAPDAFPLVDAAERIVNVTVTALGGDPAALLRWVATRTANIATVRSVQSSGGLRREVYLRLRLGDIRGFGLRVHVFAVPDDQRPWQNPYFASHLRNSGALLVSASTPNSNDPWPAALVDWVKGALSAHAAPLVGLNGDRDLIRAWSRHVGVPLVYAGTDPLTALRELSRTALRKLSSV
jgi:hypothetical protein